MNLKMYPVENSVKRSPTKKKKKGRANLESKLTEVNGGQAPFFFLVTHSISGGSLRWFSMSTYAA